MRVYNSASGAHEALDLSGAVARLRCRLLYAGGSSGIVTIKAQEWEIFNVGVRHLNFKLALL